MTPATGMTPKGGGAAATIGAAVLISPGSTTGASIAMAAHSASQSGMQLMLTIAMPRRGIASTAETMATGATTAATANMAMPATGPPSAATMPAARQMRRRPAELSGWDHRQMELPFWKPWCPHSRLLVL